MTSGQKFVHADSGVFESHFNRRPFRFKHDLATHPLLQLGALHDLATRLPPSETVHWRGDIAVGENIDTAAKTHDNGLSLKDTFDGIDRAGSYILIRNAQVDPTFARFMNEILDDVSVATEPLEPGMCQRISYIFIASPRSVTPYHMDRDVNFHFNIRGKKRISIWDPFDRVVLPETGLETLFADWNAPRPPYKAEYEERATVFELDGGDGVHHPFTAPHAIRYGDEVAVSFTVTFNTRATNRRAYAHRVNRTLRRVGVPIEPVGHSALQDEIKYNALSWLRKAKGIVRPGAQRLAARDLLAELGLALAGLIGYLEVGGLEDLADLDRHAVP